MQISAKRRPASKPPVAARRSRSPACRWTASRPATPQRLGVAGQPVGERQRAVVERKRHAPPPGSGSRRAVLQAVAAPARVAAVQLLLGHRQAERAQPPQVQAQEWRPVEAREYEGRSGVAGAMATIEPRRIPAPARAPSPPRATIVPPACPGRRRRRRARPPRSGRAASRRRLRAGVAVDDDLAAAHPRRSPEGRRRAGGPPNRS